MPDGIVREVVVVVQAVGESGEVQLVVRESDRAVGENSVRQSLQSVPVERDLQAARVGERIDQAFDVWVMTWVRDD